MTETTTGNVRGWGGSMFVVGTLALFTPVAPLGAVLAIVGGFMWLLAPATQPTTQRMVDEVSGGGWGCGPALATVGLIIVILALAGMAAAGAGLAMIEGGL